jgi:hypothetical protein
LGTGAAGAAGAPAAGDQHHDATTKAQISMDAPAGAKRRPGAGRDISVHLGSWPATMNEAKGVSWLPFR